MKRNILVVVIFVVGIFSWANFSMASGKNAKTVVFPVTETRSVSYWKPSLKMKWQIQFAGVLDQRANAEVFVVDGFDTDVKTVKALHAKGKKVVCYFSAGSLENWRPDAKKFPKVVIGKKLSGWAGENWLDIRNLKVLGPIMKARIDMCKQKGFDGVDIDNVNGYTNVTGFSLTGNDQLRYNRFLADAAHARGLAVGLTNDIDQITALVGSFDFEINEQCFVYNECSKLKPFIQAGKPVFNIEYVKNKNVCAKANVLNFNTLFKNQNLDAWSQACR